MHYNTHIRVSEQAIRFTYPVLKAFLNKYWDCVEAGLDAPDRFNIWGRDPAIPTDQKAEKVLVHRYYVDASNEKTKGGLIPEILMYAEGIISYIKDTAFENPYDDLKDHKEDWFFQFGILSHYIGNLCTPMHIGHSYNSRLNDLIKNFHNRYERNLEKFTKNRLTPPLKRYTKIALTHFALENIAKRTFEKHYIKLYDLYSEIEKNRNLIKFHAEQVFDNAVLNIAKIWNAIYKDKDVEKILSQLLKQLD